MLIEGELPELGTDVPAALDGHGVAEAFEVEAGVVGHLREPGSTAATMRWDSHRSARERSCIADTTSPRLTVRRAFVMKAGRAQQVSRP